MSGSWYVIYTKACQESRAEEHLRKQGFSVYLPRLKVPRRVKGQRVEVLEAMFPRYLFIQLQLNADNLVAADNVAPIRSTRGVSRLVRFGENPAVVSATFIDALRASEDPRTGYHTMADSRFEADSEVTVIQGPFAGVQGIVACDQGDDRVVLLLKILGRERPVRLPRDDLAQD